jgi:C_GCAxxG_C_C family probable redox protein
MKTRSDKATEKFLSGYSCAQSVVWSFCDETGLHPDTALKIACGFGGGMARRQEICGAVTGGIMVLGLAYGRGEEHDQAATEATYAKTRELMRRFEVEHGTCNCRRLLGGCDIATEEGRNYFEEHDLINRKCAPCVRTAIAILEEMLQAPMDRSPDGSV